MKLGEGGDATVAVLDYLREEEGIGAQINLHRTHKQCM